MASETPAPRQSAVGFPDAAQASRRIAGVAAAARAARGLIDRGAERVWLVFEDGGRLDAAASHDLRRLSRGSHVEVVGPDAFPGAVIPAPRLTTRDVLKTTGKEGDGLVSRHLNRPISRRISALLLRVPAIRPVHATLGTAAIATAMFVALLFGGGPGLVYGGLLFQAASIFDGVDGELARATYRVSAAGASLDSAVDMTTNIMFVLGLTANLAAKNGLIAAALGVWALCLLMAGFWLIGWRARIDEGQLGFDWLKQDVRRRFAGRPLAGLGRFATFLTTRDSIALFFMIMTLARLAMAALGVLALAATIWIVVLLVSMMASVPQDPLSEALGEILPPAPQ